MKTITNYRVNENGVEVKTTASETKSSNYNKYIMIDAISFIITMVIVLIVVAVTSPYTLFETIEPPVIPVETNYYKYPQNIQLDTVTKFVETTCITTTTVETTLPETTTVEETTNPPETTTVEETIVETEETVGNVRAANTIDDESNMTCIGNLKVTGYVATGNKTAGGDIPYVGGVAISRSYGLEFGTTIYIEGLGYYTLNDTGCAYGVIDVFCNNVEECYNLTSYANVYVVN